MDAPSAMPKQAHVRDDVRLDARVELGVLLGLEKKTGHGPYTLMAQKKLWPKK